MELDKRTSVFPLDALCCWVTGYMSVSMRVCEGKARTAGITAVAGETGLDALVAGLFRSRGSRSRGGTFPPGMSRIWRGYLIRMAFVDVSREQIAAGRSQGHEKKSHTSRLTFWQTGRRNVDIYTVDRPCLGSMN
jgi:hypothetical protein